jgi:hypothetical protein
MSVTRSGALVFGSVACAIAFASVRPMAHKSITSRYTYNTDAFPIFRDRCSGCHVDGGVAPMSLMTHADAVPWAESIRVELLAGHMPPWQVDGPPGRFRNIEPLTPHELDVLLTWATGGTPIGDTNQPSPGRMQPTWMLGTPDVVVRVPPVTLVESQREEVREFRLPLGTTQERWIRAVDLMPGTASLVRSATISAVGPSSGRQQREQVLALWQPGDQPIALDGDVGFHVPAAATLIARVRYKKSWRDESRAITDASTIGVYFAPTARHDLQPLVLAPANTRLNPEDKGPITFVQTIDHDMRALAIYPDPGLTDVSLRVVAITPDGAREPIVAFRPRSVWARRYWFDEPLALPRGTRIEVSARTDDRLLAPEAPRIPVAPLDPARLRLVMDVYAPMSP